MTSATVEQVEGEGEGILATIGELAIPSWKRANA
jgi:hypothetical protein